jgi:hypothetical protein
MRRKVTIGAPSTPEDSARLQEMFAARQAPGAKTDREFFKGRHNMENLGKHDWHINWRREEYKKKTGHYPSGNAVYEESLARFPNDTQAWIEGYGDAKRVCEKNGWGSADLGVEAVDAPPIPEVPLAEELIQQEIPRVLAETPGKKRNMNEVREQIIDRHAYKG